MTSDSQWPEQQLGDLATYQIVTTIITGGRPTHYSYIISYIISLPASYDFHHPFVPNTSGPRPKPSRW